MRCIPLRDSGHLQLARIGVKYFSFFLLKKQKKKNGRMFAARGCAGTINQDNATIDMFPCVYK